jgi:hypothetical protein
MGLVQCSALEPEQEVFRLGRCDPRQPGNFGLDPTPWGQDGLLGSEKDGLVGAAVCEGLLVRLHYLLATVSDGASSRWNGFCVRSKAAATRSVSRLLVVGRPLHAALHCLDQHLRCLVTKTIVT